MLGSARAAELYGLGLLTSGQTWSAVLLLAVCTDPTHHAGREVIVPVGSRSTVAARELGRVLTLWTLLRFRCHSSHLLPGSRVMSVAVGLTGLEPATFTLFHHRASMRLDR